MAFSVFSGHVVTVDPSIARVGLIIRLGSNIIIPHTVFASVGLWISGSHDLADIGRNLRPKLLQFAAICDMRSWRSSSQSQTRRTAYLGLLTQRCDGPIIYLHTYLVDRIPIGLAT